MTPEEKSKEISKLIKKNKKEEGFSEVNNPVYIKLDEELNKIKNANKICSFDMEFSNITGNNVVEIGVSIYDKTTKETYSEHFIIEEEIGHYKRNNTPMEHKLMFAHGESKTVSLKSAMSALNTLISNSDVSILYAQEHKHKHMLKHEFKNTSFIVIQDLLRLNVCNNQKTPLSSAVEYFANKEQPINNAGNDSAAALEILSNVFGDKINFKNYSSPIVKDYSNHVKKQSANTIRESRNNNPTPIPNDKYSKKEVQNTIKMKL